MAYRSRMLLRRPPRIFAAPMSELNITPLIDVLLVLIVMLILSIPIATHRLEVPLPGDGLEFPVEKPTEIALVVRENGAVLWNGEAVDRAGLQTRLARAAQENPGPVIRFEPEANASYDASVQVINLTSEAGIKKFAFIGNHQYRTFGKGE